MISEMSKSKIWAIYTYSDDPTPSPFKMTHFYSELEARQELEFYQEKYPAKEYWIETGNIQITDHPLPTSRQARNLCHLLQDAFVDIRYLLSDRELSEQNRKQAYDLADLFHNLPVEMYDPSSWNWDYLENNFKEYEEKYKDRTYRSYAECIRDIRRYP
jgi:hypothetical protein